jgi:hypothetical protein
MAERTTSYATKDAVCTAILERANHIACSIGERDYGIIRELWDAFHTKVPELLALLIALSMVADDERDADALARFLYELKQRIDPGEEYVWQLPHPAPRYTGWLLRQRRLPHERAVIAALRRDSALSSTLAV